MSVLNGGHESCNHKVYGLSCDQYERLLNRNGGLCEICGIPGRLAARGKLYIDHDHAGGWTAVRGLVCSRCNIRIRDAEMGRDATPGVLAYLARGRYREI